MKSFNPMQVLDKKNISFLRISIMAMKYSHVISIIDFLKKVQSFTCIAYRYLMYWRPINIGSNRFVWKGRFLRWWTTRDFTCYLEQYWLHLEEISMNCFFFKVKERYSHKLAFMPFCFLSAHAIKYRLWECSNYLH